MQRRKPLSSSTLKAFSEDPTRQGLASTRPFGSRSSGRTVVLDLVAQGALDLGALGLE